jgi:hypothetical protein
VIYLQSGFEFAKRLARNSHANYVAKVRLDITFNYKIKSPAGIIAPSGLLYKLHAQAA